MLRDPATLPIVGIHHLGVGVACGDGLWRTFHLNQAVFRAPHVKPTPVVGQVPVSVMHRRERRGCIPEMPSGGGRAGIPAGGDVFPNRRGAITRGDRPVIEFSGPCGCGAIDLHNPSRRCPPDGGAAVPGDAGVLVQGIRGEKIHLF